jgi:hypothetical protein
MSVGAVGLCMHAYAIKMPLLPSFCPHTALLGLTDLLCVCTSNGMMRPGNSIVVVS